MNNLEAELRQLRDAYLCRRKEQDNNILLSSSDSSQRKINKSDKIPACFVQTEFLKQRLLCLLDYTQTIINMYEHLNTTPQLQRHLTELHRQYTNIENATFRVGVFGYFGVGKSTLINRMLGEQNLLPVDEDRCTTAYTVIQRPDHENRSGAIRVAWHSAMHLVDELQDCLNDFEMNLPRKNEDDSTNLPQWLRKNEIIFSDIFRQMDEIDEYELPTIEKRYKLQKALALLKALPIHAQVQHAYKTVSVSSVNSLMRDPLAVPLIHSLTFYHDHQFLRHIQIIDSPGTGSVNLQDTHTAMELLELTDAILFMTDSRAPFTQSDEKQLLQWLTRLYEKTDVNNLFIIVNKTDLSEKSVVNIRDLVQKRLEKDFHGKLKPKQIYCVSCKTDQDVEPFLIQFYQFLKQEKYQILLHGAIDKSNQAFLSCLAELNKQVHFTTAHIDSINQKIGRIDMDKERLSTQMYLWLMDYDTIQYSITSQVENILCEEYFATIHSEEFRNHLVYAQVYIKKDENVEKRLITLSEEFLKRMIQTTSETLMHKFKSKIQDLDKEIIGRIEKVVMEKQKIIEIYDISYNSLALEKLYGTAYKINVSDLVNFSYLLKTNFMTFAVASIASAITGAWLAMIIGGICWPLGKLFFKKKPETIADDIIEKLDSVFINEPSSRLALIKLYEQEIKTVTDQIKGDRRIALVNLVDLIEKDLREQQLQRHQEESKKTSLNENMQLLWEEFEYIKNEYQGLYGLCNHW